MIKAIYKYKLMPNYQFANRILSLPIILKTKIMIQLHDKQFVPFISAQEIDFAIAKMVSQVEADFADETPVFVGVLNGAFMVVADFMKQYKKPCEVSLSKCLPMKGLHLRTMLNN
jgi:hypoxanthine phosphoribosyltransferase